MNNKLIKIGDEVTLNYGKGLVARDRVPGEYMVVGSNGAVDTNHEFLVEGPGIVVGRKGSVGAVTWLENNFWPIDTTYYVSLNGEGDLKYWFYQLLNLGLEKLNSHAAVPGLNRDDVYRIEVPKRSREEQQKIAKILGDLDRKIELNRRMNETLEQIGQALFKKYFIDNPESEGWEKGVLGQLADINKNTLTKDYSAEYINYIDISSVGTGKINQYQTFKLSEAPSRAKRLVSAGDIIWSTVRPNRRSFAHIAHPKNHTVASTGFVTITPQRDCLSYIYCLIVNQNFTDYLIRRAKGAAYPAVLASDFKKAPIMIPPESVLLKFNYLVKPILEQKSQLEIESEKLSKIRDLLLPKLIAGTIKI